ncbi:MAG TPA: DUF6516 family protein [Rhodopila sp.]|nr:DUF6516 family protein [Rhodopila sp.]
MTGPRDPTLDALLDLEGQVLVVDPKGGHWVRFVVTLVPVSPEKPHGIDYTLTLHAEEGERLVGFDNAHPVGRQKRGAPQDHRHRLRTVRPHEYRDAATLLADFWAVVDVVLRERGVIPWSCRRATAICCA